MYIGRHTECGRDVPCELPFRLASECRRNRTSNAHLSHHYRTAGEGRDASAGVHARDMLHTAYIRQRGPGIGGVVSGDRDRTELRFFVRTGVRKRRKRNSVYLFNRGHNSEWSYYNLCVGRQGHMYTDVMHSDQRSEFELRVADAAGKCW